MLSLSAISDIVIDLLTNWINVSVSVGGRYFVIMSLLDAELVLMVNKITVLTVTPWNTSRPAKSFISLIAAFLCRNSLSGAP